jgi:hypothetical protein
MGASMGKKWLNFIGLLFLTAASAACSDSAVGDPCIPEAVPAGGFLPTEIYLETNSLQCATRVCLVDGLDGDPTKVYDPGDPDNDTCPDDDETCVEVSEIEESVYCSVRCDAPEDAGGVPTQKCPSGFTCEIVLASGGPGLRGSYCIKDKE